MKRLTGNDETVQVLLERLNKLLLPRALRMREKVERGYTLDDYDVRILKQVIADANQALTLVSKNAEFEPLASRVIDLYCYIIKKALQNAQSD